MNKDIKELIDECTKEEIDILNVGAGLQISDRVNNHEAEYCDLFIFSCCRAVKKIMEIFSSKKSKRILLALDLIETCSKNGAKLFHKKICTEEFMGAMLKQLKYVSF